jgi:hypothetical protein
MANFKRLTRYTGGEIQTNRSNKTFLVLRRPLELEPSDGDTFVQITSEYVNRPDLISYKAYGTVDLWWVIYEFNGISDPLFELKLGAILRIPEKDRVLRAIQNLEG